MIDLGEARARAAARYAALSATRAAASTITLEWLLTSEAGFGLTTATPVQRAVCRMCDGFSLGELANVPDVVECVGGEQAVADWERWVKASLGTSIMTGSRPATPLEVYLIAAIRSGKSLIAAALAVRAALTCDLSHLGPGEVARVSVLSLSRDLADVILGHIVGRVQASPWLRQWLVEDPKAGVVLLRQPPKPGDTQERHVEIMVAAGSRAGSSLVARWSAGAIFDEAPRMVGAEDGVVNFDEARRAVLGRLIPGAQLVALGSPWAPFGPVYRAVIDGQGKPNMDRIVLRGTGPMLNPFWWTAARCEELKQRDYEAFKSDVLGLFRDLATQLFGADLITQVMAASKAGERPRVLPPSWVGHESRPSQTTHWAMDPATRSDTWSLVGVRRKVRYWVGPNADPEAGAGLATTLEVIGVWWWTPQGGEKLRPRQVLTEIASIMRPYGARTVVTDQWAADALQDIGLLPSVGLVLDDQPWDNVGKVVAFSNLKAIMQQNSITLPDVPELRDDLMAVQKKVTATTQAIELLRVGGRHADLAVALALAVAQVDYWTGSFAGGPAPMAQAIADGDPFAGKRHLEGHETLAGNQPRARPGVAHASSVVTLAQVRGAFGRGGF